MWQATPHYTTKIMPQLCRGAILQNFRFSFTTEIPGSDSQEVGSLADRMP
jgi:hypothetical protein